MLPQVVASAEPVVVNGALVGIGGVVVWLARQVVGMRDDLREFRQEWTLTMFGNPKDPHASGLVARVSHIEGRTDTLETRMDFLDAKR